MAMIGQTTKAPATTTKPPTTKAPAAAPAPATKPTAAGNKKFASAKPRGGAGLFLKGQPDGTAAKYTLKVNRVAQSWANPKLAMDYEERPKPTEEELATAKPTFKKQDNYVIEVEVTKSNSDACPPGYIASIVFTDKYEESYFDDIKGFLCACANAEPEQIDLDDWKASYQPDQPLAGFLVDCIVAERPTRSGGVFTKHVFNVSKDQYPE